MLLDLDTSFPVLGNGKESFDFGKLSKLVNDLLDLSCKFSRWSETDGLG